MRDSNSWHKHKCGKRYRYNELKQEHCHTDTETKTRTRIKYLTTPIRHTETEGNERSRWRQKWSHVHKGERKREVGTETNKDGKRHADGPTDRQGKKQVASERMALQAQLDIKKQYYGR